METTMQTASACNIAIIGEQGAGEVALVAREEASHTHGSLERALWLENGALAILPQNH